MGQKVSGYRRNVPYGQETNLLYDQSKGETQGWMFRVNPKGRVGWNRGTSGRKESDYGSQLTHARRLRKEREEARRKAGAESNGMGRKGTKERGYEVHGEYVLGERTDADRREVSRDRIGRKYEKKRQTKIDRKRRSLSKRRQEYGREAQKEKRRSVLGPNPKRTKPKERCEAIALSGSLPTGKRRTNLMVRELENGLNHMEVRRRTENLRSHHARGSENGRKRLGDVPTTNDPNQGPRGYYGYKVRVYGPLEGSRRTLTYRIQMGTVPRGMKRARRRTTKEHAKTKVGTIGVQVHYCYGLRS